MGLENVLRGGEGVKEMEEIISLFFAPAKSSMLGKCQSTVKSRKRKWPALSECFSESNVHCTLWMLFSVCMELVRPYSSKVFFGGKANILNLIKLYICIINKNVIDTVVRIYGTFPVSQQCNLSAW